MLIQKPRAAERATSTVVFHDSEPAQEQPQSPAESTHTYEISDVSRQVAVTLEGKCVVMKRLKKNKVLQQFTIEQIFVNAFSRCEELP